jgi:hypothetical protein
VKFHFKLGQLCKAKLFASTMAACYPCKRQARSQKTSYHGSDDGPASGGRSEDCTRRPVHGSTQRAGGPDSQNAIDALAVTRIFPLRGIRDGCRNQRGGYVRSTSAVNNCLLDSQRWATACPSGYASQPKCGPAPPEVVLGSLCTGGSNPADLLTRLTRRRVTVVYLQTDETGGGSDYRRLADATARARAQSQTARVRTPRPST